MKITNTELKVIRFSNEDVIATSTYAFQLSNGSYELYSGTIGAYDSTEGAWTVNRGDYLTTMSADDFAANNTSLSGSLGSQIHSLYGAYGDGPYYTKGATYIELNGGNVSAEIEGPGASGFPTENPSFPMP